MVFIFTCDQVKVKNLEDLVDFNLSFTVHILL